MAGTDPRFDATVFRDAIRFAMNMGLPDSTSEQATFKWDTDQTFAVADASGRPFSWDAAIQSEVTFVDVIVPVAVETLAKGGDTLDTRIGEFDVPRVTITVLDTDYESLTQNDVFANKVQLDDATYMIQYVAPPIGLFDVTVYQIHCQAIDES